MIVLAILAIPNLLLFLCVLDIVFILIGTDPVIALRQVQGCSEATTESIPRGILLLPQFVRYHEPVNLVSNSK